MPSRRKHVVGLDRQIDLRYDESVGCGISTSSDNKNTLIRALFPLKRGCGGVLELLQDKGWITSHLSRYIVTNYV